MTQGNLSKWYKGEGDEIAAGDVLADIETDKATMAFENQEDGFIAKILVAEGAQNVQVGEVVAIVVEEAADVAKFASYSADGGASAASTTPPAAAETGSSAPTAGGSGDPPPGVVFTVRGPLNSADASRYYSTDITAQTIAQTAMLHKLEKRVCVCVCVNICTDMWAC